MSELAELEAELTALGGRDVPAAMLLRAVRLVAQALEQIARHREELRDTVVKVNQFEERLLLVDALPPEAPFGALIRLRTGPAAGRAPLYLGNGPGQPLSKLVPVPV